MNQYAVFALLTEDFGDNNQQVLHTVRLSSRKLEVELN